MCDQAPLSCTEEDAARALDEFADLASSMFGRHARCAAVGITGAVELDSLDGPIVLVKLSGRFWHKRATVLRNCRTYLMQRIPELSDVDLADPDDELDLIYDDETGELAEDRRAPDWNGDRDALTYQGIDPDMRGPFPGNVGGLRPGGSIFS